MVILLTSCPHHLHARLECRYQASISFKSAYLQSLGCRIAAFPLCMKSLRSTFQRGKIDGALTSSGIVFEVSLDRSPAYADTGIPRVKEDMYQGLLEIVGNCTINLDQVLILPYNVSISRLGEIDVSSDKCMVKMSRRQRSFNLPAHEKSCIR